MEKKCIGLKSLNVRSKIWRKSLTLRQSMRHTRLNILTTFYNYYEVTPTQQGNYQNTVLPVYVLLPFGQ